MAPALDDEQLMARVKRGDRAGVAGSGGSSYIYSVILRDRDANTNWEAQADATLEERTYTCQNWRADVVALMTSGGVLVNQVRYDPYGKPFGIAKTDLEADGDVDSVDYLKWLAYYSASTMPFADWNWDGSTDSADNTAYAADRSADTAIGRGALGYAYSHANGASRKGYAGYEVDPVLTGSEGWESVYHVRHRVYLSQLGRWTRRDPLGYVDGMSVYSYATQPLLATDSSGLATCPQRRGGCGRSGPPQPIVPVDPIDGTPLPRYPCEGDPEVERALRLYKASCGGGRPSFTPDPKQPAGGAEFCCWTNTIKYYPGVRCGVLAHEIVHAADACTKSAAPCEPTSDGCGGAKSDRKGCAYAACTEGRANSVSCCDPNGEGRQGKTYAECLQAQEDHYTQKFGGICPRFRADFHRCSLSEAEACTDPDIPAYPPPPAAPPASGGGLLIR